MDSPTVTCITPTYGRFSYLCEMLWCWRNQTYQNKELIIVNDQKNLTIECDEPNVKVFNFDERFVGLGAKRNFAISQATATSQFICPFDDDDLFFPEHIEFLVSIFAENPEAERTKNLKHFVSIDNDHFHLSHDANQTYFGASLFRKDSLLNNPFKDHLIMGEDTDLFSRKTFAMQMKQNPLISSFVHRRGMGIPHASSVHYNASMPSEIAKEFYNKTTQLRQPNTIKIIPKLAQGRQIYEKIDRFRLDSNNLPSKS